LNGVENSKEFLFREKDCSECRIPSAQVVYFAGNREFYSQNKSKKYQESLIATSKLTRINSKHLHWLH